ncbi:PIN domain-containing protein [Candidatus Magnetominusculus xianensis]|nr:PIN domain-containing protein [Candidatus Magnetominusculus xianensis]MBF0405337.1 PIN domain-containing protein [Nitrospirota bacterium]
MITLSVEDYLRSLAGENELLVKIQSGAKDLGLDQMTDEEIDAEILSYRKERRKFKQLRNKYDTEIKTLFSSFQREALWVKPVKPVGIIKHDPADNKFLECALSAQADYVNTGNIRHFPFGQFEKMLIVTPQEIINQITPLYFK